MAGGLIIGLAMIAGGSACSSDPSSQVVEPSSTTTTSSPSQPPTAPTSTSTPTSEPSTAEATTPREWPPFTSSVEPISTERLGVTWRPGCPVGADALRLVTITYAQFEGGPATGELIVAAEAVDDVVAAFRDLYAARFPIRKMITMEAYGGDDERASAEDNTSGFNCRNVLGTDRWSQHSYGLAIDINPLENPYLVGGEIRPPAGAEYLDRTDVRPGMIVEGDVVFRAFTSRGFEWGGFFVSTPDYQHFARPR
jgi:hypothetical protein